MRVADTIQAEHGSCRSARLHVPTSQRPPLDYIEEFCKMFVPEQARYAPERGVLVSLISPLMLKLWTQSRR